MKQVARRTLRGALNIFRARAVPGDLCSHQRIVQIGNREALADAFPQVKIRYGDVVEFAVKLRGT